MLVGHLALGFVGKRVEPRVSLGTWMLAVMLADLLAFCFFIAGIERAGNVPDAKVNRFFGDIPYSHSLAMDILWGALLAAVCFLLWRQARAAWLLGAAVISHWLLDFLSHRPDMQLLPGRHAAFGLGLWNSFLATVAVEGGCWVLAVVLYVRFTSAKRRAGVYAFWPGIALLTLVWYGNITAGVDPNPVRAGISGLIFFCLTIAWAYWMDRARLGPTTSAARSPREPRDGGVVL